MTSPLVTLYRIFSAIVALVGGSLSILLLTTGESVDARLFGVTALILSLLPLIHCITRELMSDFLTSAAFLLFVIAVALGGWLFYRAPGGRAAEGARAQNRYIGKWAYPQTSIGNLVPELDQLRLGLKLAPFADKLLTRQRADQLTELTSTIYRELESDAEFHALGTTLPHVYDALWSGRSNHRHYFLYIPKQIDRKQPAPLLVFLHGSGGNFKAYTWLLSKVAEQLGMILVAPSMGVGEWHDPVATEVVTAVLHNVGNVAAIDPKRRHLIGLSNGALGVCRAGSHVKDGFQSFIFISPVMDLRVPALPIYAGQWRNRPTLMLTGEADDRVPIASVQEAAAKLRELDAKVTLQSYPGADHFLLFSHREQLLARLTDWLTQFSTAGGH